MRKGYCTSDARLLFFENGLLYCKLTEASRIRKGQLLVIFVAVRVCFFGMLIESLEVSPRFGSFAFAKSVGVLIEKFDLSQSFAFPEKFCSI